MRNFVAKGLHMTVPSPADVLSGGFVLIGGLFGVAQTDALSGKDVAIVTSGVFTMPKATGAAWAIGDLIYWDAGAGKMTKTSSSNTLVGLAAAAALSGDTEGDVVLRP